MNELELNFVSKKFRDYTIKLGNELNEDLEGNFHYNLNATAENSLLKDLTKNSFFGLINVIKTRDPIGETLGINLPIANTVNTELEERTPTKGYISPNQKFNCEQINIDTFVKYQKLDKSTNYLDIDFQQVFDNELSKQMLLSLLMIGFNGEKRVNHSNSEDYPLGQDVKKGWLQKIRENAQEKIISTANIGKNEEYKSLTSLVNAAKKKINHPLRLSNDLVVLCGKNVLNQKVSLTHSDFLQENSERMTIIQELIGGLKVINVPFFPENSLLITKLSNISLYLQSGTVRRFTLNEPQYDRISNYISMSLDFIIEDYSGVALIENINMVED